MKNQTSEQLALEIYKDMHERDAKKINELYSDIAVLWAVIIFCLIVILCLVYFLIKK